MTATQTKSVQSFASKGIVCDFAAGTLNNRVVRNYAIIRETALEGGKVVIASETLVSQAQLLNLVALKLAGKTAAQAKGMVFKALEQALFVETSGYGLPVASSNLPTDIEVANANRAYVLSNSASHLTAANLDSKTVQRLVAQTTLAICPDKQVKKAVLIGDGATAAGVYRNADTLTSVNPIADFTKGINRANAGFAGKAVSSERVVANLVHEAEGGNFVKEGILKKAVFVPGLAVLAQGMISLNEGVSFDFSTPKTFARKFVIETIGTEVNEINFDSNCVYHSEITVNGVVIYTHTDNTQLEIHSVTPSLNEAGTVWTFDIDATMVATGKTNIKARDFGCKGMTHRSGVTIAETSEWDMLFTSESIKTSEAVRTMYCQANSGHTLLADGTLQNVNGEEVTSATINAWYRANGQYFTVRTPVDASNVKSLQSATGTAVEYITVDGVIYAEQRVFGICADYLFNIELSSSDEIAGYTRSDVTGTTIQSLINSTISAKLAK